MSSPTDSGSTDGTGALPPARRRRVAAAVVALLVAALVVVALGLRDRDGDDASAAEARSTAGATTAATTGATPAPSATSVPTATATAGAATPAAEPAVDSGAAVGPTEGGDVTPTALPEVPLDAPAAVGNGVVATLPAIDAVEGQASGPGNVNGPALRVTVRVQNGTDQPIALDGVAVNLYHGADRTPASPLDDAAEQPFAGTLAAGQSADAVYVFSVPADVRDAITVEVGYEAGAPLLLFTGPVG
jgi:hypothetical protein